MTQALLAQKIGITDKAVSKWERDISYPDIALFPKLADILGVSIDDLLTGCADGQTPPRLARIFQMSHDIRTPLNIILGYANMAVKYHDDTGRLLRYLENIRVSGEYLLGVIDRLMEVAHPQGGAPGARPLAPADIAASDPDTRAGKARASLGDWDFSGKRVLLVEDIELNREIAFEILKQTGIAVEFAVDGAECVEKVRRAEAGHYDLILMDIQMPNMNGIEATAAIRAMEDRRKAATPIIAMTASVYAEDRTAAFSAGMNDFTEKPIVVEQLYETMSKYL